MKNVALLSIVLVLSFAFLASASPWNFDLNGYLTKSQISIKNSLGVKTIYSVSKKSTSIFTVKKPVKIIKKPTMSSAASKAFAAFKKPILLKDLLAKSSIRTTPQQEMCARLRDPFAFRPAVNSEAGRAALINCFCKNGVFDRSVESDVDCGGICKKCKDRKNCTLNLDCNSGYCGPQGKCLPPANRVCRDSDPANYFSQRGVVQLQSGETVRDFCQNSTMIVQVDCGNNADPKRKYAAKQIVSPCPADRPRCDFDLGICRSRQGELCTDTDPSNDFAIIGIAVDDDQQIIDQCSDDWNVRQVSCSNGVVQLGSPQQCPLGMACRSGMCISDAVCTEPNINDHYPNSTIREISGRRHIDTCASEDNVRHIACSQYGQPTVSITVCPDGLQCVNGLCGEEWIDHCVDSDPANDLHVQGHALDASGNEAWDGCDTRSSTIVREAICMGNVAIDTPMQCTGNNEVCVNGKCAVVSCNDNDPNNDVTNQGTATQHIPGEDDQQLVDYCPAYVPSDAPVPSREQVVEVKCDEFNRVIGHRSATDFEENRVNCPAGTACISGACIAGVTPYCMDYDGGQDIFNNSFVQSNRLDSEWQYASDFCRNSTFVGEMYCRENGYVTAIEIACPVDRPLCAGGACASCFDSDAYNDLHWVGTVQDKSLDIHTDFCRGNDVVEVDCGADGYMVENQMSCQQGERCVNGLCTAQ